MSFIFILYLGSWFLISILAQVHRFRRLQRLRYRDMFFVLPHWHFFAPNPKIDDFHLLYRDKLFDGQYTPWREIAFKQNAFWRGLWNPERRLVKTLEQMSNSMCYFADKPVKKKRLLVSVSYIVLLNYVMSLPYSNLSDFRQFLIAKTFGYYTSQEPEIVFVSYLHSYGRIR